VQEVSSSSEVNFMNDNKKSSYGDTQLSVQPIKKKTFIWMKKQAMENVSRRGYNLNINEFRYYKYGS